MLPEDSSICFESPSLANLYLKAYPEWAERIFTFDALTDLMGEKNNLSDIERKDLWVKEYHQSEATLKTIETLRRALVLQPSDVDFCFSLLEDNPKNRELKEAFHLYLSTPLSQDSVNQIWTTRERLMTPLDPEMLPPVIRKVWFIPSVNPAPLFLATAEGFKMSGATVTVSETIEDSGICEKRAVAITGNTTLLISELLERIKNYPSPQVILFEGETKELTFLKMKLSHNKLSSVSILPWQLLPGDFRYPVHGYFNPVIPKIETDLLNFQEKSILRKNGIQIDSINEQIQQKNRSFLSFLTKTRNFRSWMGIGENSKDVKPSLKRLFFLRSHNTHKKSPLSSYRVELGLKSFSATQLESYSECPSRYLFGNRMKLEVKSKYAESKAPLLFGQSVHLCLERAVPTKDYSPESLIKLWEVCLKEIAPEIQETDPVFSLLKVRFLTVAHSFEGLENKLSELFPGRRPLYFELPFETTFEGVPLRGKIDRIDETSSGKLLIIDYKTGKVDFSPPHNSF
jgi:hypothetical protein